VGEIFLSYSRNDQEFADQLTQSLQEHGVQVWVDRQNIQAGEAWRAAISHAIATCDAFLVILSPQCIVSKNVPKELSIAESKERHIIPIMYQQCEIPDTMQYQLIDLQWIDFSASDFVTALDQLLKVLQHGKPQRASAIRSALSQPFPSQPAAASAPAVAPSFPPAQPAPSPGTSPQLATILCGRWNIQIAGPIFATLVLDILPNGTFNGQRMNPVEGPAAVNGVWRITPFGQLMLQGQQGNGWMMVPFGVVVQFTQVSPNALSGMSTVGEQLTWTKVA
jgi:TIR domain-containing protein